MTKPSLNQDGIITVDFMFAIVLILGLTSLLFVLSFTLSVASIVQYATFAAARNYAAGNLTMAVQEARAKSKYKAVIGNPTFKPLFTNGWFQVDAEATVGDHTKVSDMSDDTGNEFWGASTQFTAKILDFKIPFFGSTAPEGDGSGSGFKTKMMSFLGREPSEQECNDLNLQRWTQIQTLGSGYDNAKGDYHPMSDNGC